MKFTNFVIKKCMMFVIVNFTKFIVTKFVIRIEYKRIEYLYFPLSKHTVPYEDTIYRYGPL